MLDKNLKSELIKAYNNVSKTSKVEFNQQNLDELIKLFHDNQYLSIKSWNRMLGRPAESSKAFR